MGWTCAAVWPFPLLVFLHSPPFHKAQPQEHIFINCLQGKLYLWIRRKLCTTNYSYSGHTKANGILEIFWILIHPKGDQSWVFIGRTDVEAETPILWPPDAKNWLTGKDPDVGKDWAQEEKGTTEDETVGWHHRLNAHGFGWTMGVGDRQGGLACCGS